MTMKNPGQQSQSGGEKTFRMKIRKEKGRKNGGKERVQGQYKCWQDYSWFHHGFGPFTASSKNLLACE